MIKHIVIWKLKEEASGGSRTENALKMKQMLEALTAKVPGIVSLEVGLKTDKAPANNDDVILVSEFASWHDLDVYATHPEHLKVVDFVKSVVERRAVVDYEL